VLYLDVFGSFVTSATALTRGFGDKPVLQTRRPKGTATRVQNSKKNCGLVNIHLLRALWRSTYPRMSSVNFGFFFKDRQVELPFQRVQHDGSSECWYLHATRFFQCTLIEINVWVGGWYWNGGYFRNDWSNDPRILGATSKTVILTNFASAR